MRPRLIVAAWIVSVIGAGVLTLHAFAIVPIRSQSTQLSAIQPLQGLAYQAALPPREGVTPETPDVQLLEDGRPLPYPSMTGSAVIAADGGGRYRVEGRTIYFSSSDGTDPRTNGRAYTAVEPTAVPARAMKLAWGVAALLGLALVALNARAAGRLLARPPFVVAAVVLIALVAANRIWMFVDFPLVSIQPDSSSYYLLTEQIGNGPLPSFSNRPPVYPLFMKAVFAIRDRAIFLSFCQSLLSLTAMLMLALAAYRWHPVLAIPMAITLAMTAAGYGQMEHDTAMLSDGVYASLLMLAFAALLLAIPGRSALAFALSSTVMALAILTRPAGMFLLGTYALVVGWLLWMRYGRRMLIAFAVPLPLIMTLISVYNYVSVKAFSPSTWAEANLAVATFLYWEQDPSYPPEINSAIADIQASVGKRLLAINGDRGLLDRSNDPDRLAPIFFTSFDVNSLNIAMRMGGDSYETTGRQWIRRIAFDSIRKHPVYYGKFLGSMLYLYFVPQPEWDFRAFMQNRAYAAYVERRFTPPQAEPLIARMGKEFASGTVPPKILILPETATTKALDRVIIPPTRWWRVYHATAVLRRAVFARWVWPLMVFIALAASVIRLVTTRLRHDGAFALFIVSVSAIGASLVVSLVEFSNPRYSFPMEWVYGAAAALLPLLFLRSAPGPDPRTPRD